MTVLLCPGKISYAYLYFWMFWTKLRSYNWYSRDSMQTMESMKFVPIFVDLLVNTLYLKLKELQMANMTIIMKIWFYRNICNFWKRDIGSSEKMTSFIKLNLHTPMRDSLFFLIYLAVCLFFTNKSEFWMRACDVIKSHFASDAALESKFPHTTHRPFPAGAGYGLWPFLVIQWLQLYESSP